MKECYTIRLSPASVAIADLTHIEENVWELNRINVPARFRGQGHGSELMNRILEDADASESTIVLTINPYGDLTWDQLRFWYESRGFETGLEGWDDELFVRLPEG